MPYFRDRVAEYFREREGCWIDGEALRDVGGKYAWRSRVSDCRTELGMDIKNRQRRLTDAQGRRWCVSEYQYLPAQPTPADEWRAVFAGAEQREGTR